MSVVFLGADIGTSGLKVTAIGDDGAVLAEAEASYPVDTPRPGWAETDPSRWEDALSSALARIAPQLGARTVAGLGIDGQMHGLVLLDDAGAACRPAILWPDRRAEDQLPTWRALPPTLRARLANPLAAGMAGPLLGWLARHEPQVLDRAAAAVQPKDYVRARLLGGSPVTERSDASATLLWDVPGDSWAHDVLDALGLPDRLLPAVVPSDHVVGTAQLAELPAATDVPIVAGAGDTPSALLATGGLAPGQVQVNLGTGAQILLGVERPHPTPDSVTHLYADTEHGWYAMAAVQNAGLALDRVRTWLGMTWQQLYTAAADSEPGAGGVSVLPFLTGERGGIATPTSRGAWLGLGHTTTSGDLARAAVEGMLFTVRRGLELLRVAPKSVSLTGGGARDPLIPHTLANLLDATVVSVPDRSSSAIGAAMLAARGVGETLPRPATSPTGIDPRPSAALDDGYRRWLDRLPTAEL